jgi:serine/threonine protein kinase
LQEIANHKLFGDNDDTPKTYRGEFDYIVRCYGISRDSATKNYLMVMEYMEGGDLRKYLSDKAPSFHHKLCNLQYIVGGIKSIHSEGLVHKDLHTGNILSSNDFNFSYITDLGLSQPASYQKQEGQTYGVLPYVAPEVLQGQPYTQASDVYSFGIIAYELFANTYPYPKMDDLELSLKICNELKLRPDIDKVPIPQLLKDLIKRC